MPNTTSVPTETTTNALARYEAMCANPARHNATAWIAMSRLLLAAAEAMPVVDGVRVDERAVKLLDRAEDCEKRARRITLMRSAFGGAVGAGFRGGEAA